MMTRLLCLLSPRIDVAKKDRDGPVHRFTDLFSDWYSTLSPHARVAHPVSKLNPTFSTSTYTVQ